MLPPIVILHEPTTFLTDGMLGALAATLAWCLPVRNDATRWWRRMFIFTAISALAGGSYHGFAPNFPEPIQLAWWIATLWIIGGLSVCMSLSLLHELVPLPRQQPWLCLIGGKFLACAGAALIHPEFIVVIVDYGLTMLAWLAASLLLRRAWRRWMLLGLALSILAAVVQQAGWPATGHFNHNDLYHVIQALGLVAFSCASRHFDGAKTQGMSAN